MTKKPLKHVRGKELDYGIVLGDVARIIEAARRSAMRTVNSVMTAAYWLIGRRIVEFEQAGSIRAEYGSAIIERLSSDLTAKFGRGFGAVNLSQMKKFYLLWSAKRILQTLSEKSRALPGQRDRREILQTLSEKSQPSSADIILRSAAECFPLPWSAYVRLLSVKNDNARAFYETEALWGGWSVRQLNRQINSQFYERTALSKNKAAMLRKGQEALPNKVMAAEYRTALPDEKTLVGEIRRTQELLRKREALSLPLLQKSRAKNNAGKQRSSEAARGEQK